MIAGAGVLVLLPLAMGVVAYFLIRWKTLAALCAIATAIVVGVGVLVLPFGQPVDVGGEAQLALGESVSILGRELVLEAGDRIGIAFLFISAAVLFTLAWRFGSQRLLFPVGLGLLSLLTAALLIQPRIYAALLVEIAAVISVLVLQHEGQSPTRGGVRFLAFSLLALPGLLVTHWLLERYAFTPNETALLDTATALWALSFAFLLGVIPFHSWVPAITSDGMPLGGIFVLTIWNGAIWFLLLDFLETYPWLSDHPSFGPLLLTIGLVMVIVGGVLAVAQRRLGRLIGYAALIDTGCALMALSMNSKLGVTLVFLSLLVRPLGLILMASGLSGAWARSHDDSLDALQGRGWPAPWSTAAFVVGGLSIAGWPLGAGFVWRWAHLRALASYDPRSTLFPLLAGAAVMIGVWRGVSVLFQRPRTPDGRLEPFSISSEDWLTATIVAGAIVACIFIGLFPQTIGPIATHLAESYTFFVP